MADDTEDAPGANFSAGKLKSLIQRIERLETDKAAIAEDIKEVYSEAKSQGFQVPIIRQVIRLRKMEDQKRIEMTELLELYQSVLGDLRDTPLGNAAVAKIKAA
jgi:uncharacterized protein (UPF0335 family)